MSLLSFVLAADYSAPSRSANCANGCHVGGIKRTIAFALPKECTTLALFGDPVRGG